MNSIALSKRKDFAAYRATWVFAAALCLLILQALQAAAQMLPNTFADLAEEISPSVVNITTTTVIAGRADQMPRGIVPKGSPFEEFFREFEDRRRGGNGGASRSSALGSGFVISADGFIVTNNHVIEGADEIEVEFFSGERLAAKVIGTDKNTDIAVLKVDVGRTAAFRQLSAIVTQRAWAIGSWRWAILWDRGSRSLRESFRPETGPCLGFMTTISKRMPRLTGAILVGLCSIWMVKLSV